MGKKKNKRWQMDIEEKDNQNSVQQILLHIF